MDKLPNIFNRPEKLANTSNDELIKQIFPRYSVVQPGSMEFTINASFDYYSNRCDNINDSIVECGVWRGGMSVLLSKLFLNRKIFLCDSFKGFEPIENSPYSLPLHSNPNGPEESKGAERHIPGKLHIWEKETLTWEVSEEQVRKNLLEFGLIPEQHGIELVSGYIRDSLPSKLDEIGTIGVLRIDLDAFAATYECLNILYDKVAVGGIIIFDDFPMVEEATLAIKRFRDERKLDFEFKPTAAVLGSYIIKK